MLAPSHSRQLVAWLDEDQSNRALVGGKGLSLSQLTLLGAPVPPAFALTTAAYDLAAAALALPITTRSFNEAMLSEIRDRVARSPLPPLVTAALADGYVAMQQRARNASSLAVRSSAPAEDSAESSFAGVHDTFLDIHSLSSLESAVRRCWASLWSERAVTYRHLHDMDSRSPTIAVVVQQMISSDVSFVVFTSDPVNARDGHLVISASWGLGEAIVSGQVTPDHIVVSPEGEIVTYVVGKKQIMIIPGATATAGTREVAVPRALQELPALSIAQVAAIAELARSLAPRLGYEADLEGAFSAEQLYLFQARPITATTTADVRQRVAAPIRA